MKSNAIGLAGEFRVMSELIIRGHNPAKSYLEDGADLILENGLRVEVKTGHLKKRICGEMYSFDMRRGNKKLDYSHSSFDFLICWLIEDSSFYIIPRDKIKSPRTLAIYKPRDNSKSQYNIFRESWYLLDKEEF